ncbi:hypothetical protein HC891_23680 [Candidatus Gracilibacteria bacterium]|nr:hypothetical protein [Candidatus Gracilibacteria bacterium]
MRSAAGRWLSATVLLALIAVTLTWPLSARLATQLPLGTEDSATVPLFNLWTLRWNAEQLLVSYARYWDAPIFYPTAGAFAFSEPQPLTGLFFTLLWRLGGNDVLAYNLVLLFALTVNGIAATWMLRQLGVTPAPACSAARSPSACLLSRMNSVGSSGPCSGRSFSPSAR